MRRVLYTLENGISIEKNHHFFLESSFVSIGICTDTAMIFWCDGASSTGRLATIPPSIYSISWYRYGANIPGILIEARMASTNLPSSNTFFSPVPRSVAIIFRGISVSEISLSQKYCCKISIIFCPFIIH